MKGRSRRKALVHFQRKLVPGRFLYRLNRFAAAVEVEGTPALAHVANSGRLRELFYPGNRVFLMPRDGKGRKTVYDLALVAVGGTLVSIDARLPPALVREALALRRLPEFNRFTSWRREVRVGDSRLDLLLEGSEGRCYVETKSVTLVEDGVGLFPDAPTLRGLRHVRELARLVAGGCQGTVVFVVQREDAVAFAPNWAADPAFAQALQDAVGVGVQVAAYRCRVSLDRVELLDSVTVRLGSITLPRAKNGGRRRAP